MCPVQVQPHEQPKSSKRIQRKSQCQSFCIDFFCRELSAACRTMWSMWSVCHRGLAGYSLHGQLNQGVMQSCSFHAFHVGGQPGMCLCEVASASLVGQIEQAR